MFIKINGHYVNMDNVNEFGIKPSTMYFDKHPEDTYEIEFNFVSGKNSKFYIDEDFKKTIESFLSKAKTSEA